MSSSTRAITCSHRHKKKRTSISESLTGTNTLITNKSRGM